MKNEIIIYRPNEAAEHIEVRLENDTVWLNRQQISTLFGRDVKTIGKHISNALNEELEGIPTVANFAIVHFEGKRKVKRNIEFYNLDVIISVGYRVKSKQGTQFRIWATTVLREYLLKGYAINQRVNRIENNLENLSNEVNKISLQLKTNELPTQGIFFEGQLFDAYVFANDLIKSANKSIILIDNYVDESTLLMLSKRNSKCNATIYTQKLTAQLQLDLAKHNEQYPRIDIKTLKTSHDRFLILDGKEVYHIGASLKDLGKKWFAFSKLDAFLPTILEKLKD
ncbi:MAG: virulence RhuM family protein [Crocinitomicaceae bacterium]|nr:virulence RhuM family protein [Crocinitomicaceae bacterium]MCF8434924.1 virulence RhuM family protein [Crocinitomicaceae bacterium]